MTVPRTGITRNGFWRYCASRSDCSACPLKDKCCPGLPARTITRHILEAARDIARRLAGTE
ncbi:hypothetical protein V6Z69_05830 [Cereibacter sphaeroides]|uniref:IS1182 family transposase n=1 Tax=Cereibacter sphaeroides TaxID=1063 RepID=UPI0002A3AB11|nr:IS1182 family transposase [Cereibacter sphaeroides]EKX59646.1 transposase, IS4 family protein [Rhodobacter sp. AKP1]